LRDVKKACKSQDPQEDVKVVEDKSKEELLTLYVTTNNSTKGWMIDNGYTNHITYDKKLFKKLKKLDISKVRIENKNNLLGKVQEQFSIKTHSGINFYFFYVIEITQNSLSISQMLEEGFKVSIENKLCVIKNATYLEVFKVHMKDNIFGLNLMKEELTTNEENIKEGSKSKDE